MHDTQWWTSFPEYSIFKSQEQSFWRFAYAFFFPYKLARGMNGEWKMIIWVIEKGSIAASPTELQSESYRRRIHSYCLNEATMRRLNIDQRCMHCTYSWNKTDWSANKTMEKKTHTNITITRRKKVKRV